MYLDRNQTFPNLASVVGIPCFSKDAAAVFPIEDLILRASSNV